MTTLGYIGSKKSLLEFLEEHIGPRLSRDSVFADLFAGTGVVGRHFKHACRKTITNDVETYSYVINRAMITVNYTDKLKNIIADLDAVPPLSGMITTDFAKDRKFFTESNAEKIDAIRTKIDTLKADGVIDEDEYFYLLACLLVSADKVANTASVYGAYLKQYKTSAMKTLELKPIHTNRKNARLDDEIFQRDALDLVNDNAMRFDVAYIDPPYNQRQYSSNYSVLNSIVLNDPDMTIKGVAGVIADAYKSPFCRKTEVARSFDDLIKDTRATYVFVSYNNEGVLPEKEMTEIFEKHGKVTLHEKEYKKFRSQKGSETKVATTVREFLYEIEKTPTV